MLRTFAPATGFRSGCPTGSRRSLPSLPAGDSNVASSSDALPDPISNVTSDVRTLPGGDSNITTYLDTLPDTTDIGPLPVPLDVTGELPIPGTPLPLEPSGGKKPRLWHKGRKFLLRKPVLVLIVGRQLAGPTKEALKLISKEIKSRKSVYAEVLEILCVLFDWKGYISCRSSWNGTMAVYPEPNQPMKISILKVIKHLYDDNYRSLIEFAESKIALDITKKTFSDHKVYLMDSS